MFTTYPVHTATLVSTDDGRHFGWPSETLAAKFARCHRDFGGAFTTTTEERHSAALFAARRQIIGWTDDGECHVTSLTVGQVYALWVAARIDEIEAEWSDTVDALLAEPVTPENHAEWSEASRRADRRRARKLNETVRKAYGATWTGWAAR